MQRSRGARTSGGPQERRTPDRRILQVWFTDQEDGQDGVEPIDPDEIGGEASGRLPSTGSSQTIMVSSAAALLAGAVVCSLPRRRKSAANRE